MQVSVETAQQLGLLPEEFEKIKGILGRDPNFTELSIYSVMWSEHCSYKNSIRWLKTLPREGAAMLAAAGEENAGLMDIGDGLAVCFKIESHNHPSAIEPYQGAATGVGGINRDIFSMGARPIAQLNSLRFGLADNDRTRWLVDGVVRGIGDYGNAFGIPVVGGEVYFDECYHTNNLVNAMSVGIARVGKTASAGAPGPGNPVFIFGSSTGKDGIHGAAFASKDISEDSADDLPSVQVGDPFWEKLILEATMEMIETGAVLGLQDMGAAGITCSTSEMSAKSGTGMRIHLDKAPLRQPDMKDWEILLSESQERMLAVVQKGREAEVERILQKWELTYAQIGEVTDTGRVQYYMQDGLCADIPAESLVLGGGAPVYEREYEEPEYIAKVKSFNSNEIMVPENLPEVAKFLAGHPNIASKRWIYRQYDSTVGTVNRSTNRPSDAASVMVRESGKTLVMTVDCNSRYVYADPETGAAIAVAEAARNIACTGGRPLGITNCLNFGNPYNKGVYWQFVGAIKGMGAACSKFGTPVTGGNVSFYNQSTMDGTAVFPTPTIGMVGLLDAGKKPTTLAFEEAGDAIYLLGKETEDLASSQYLVYKQSIAYSPVPYFNLDEEYAMQQQLLNLIDAGLINSAHDCAEGGLFIALMESALVNKLGFDISNPKDMRADALLFGESQGRVVISVKRENAEKLEAAMKDTQVPLRRLGEVSIGHILVNGEDFGHISQYHEIYENSLERLIDRKAIVHA